MKTRIIDYYFDVAGAMLVAMTLMVFIGLHAGANLVWPPDAILEISLRVIYWVIATLMLAGALICLLSQSVSLKASLILWLMADALVYAIAVQWDKGDFSVYLVNAARPFNIAPATALWLAKFVCLYFVVGSGMALWLDHRQAAYLRRNPLPESVKMPCPQCGGKIKFALQNLGQNIPCPHCQTAITLRKPENLKMSCFFCQGHLEFPAHAIGEKMPCPHCKMGITLKETV